MSNAKYLEVEGMLHQQIKEKAYALNELPSERKVATQFGVSYMTARKAVQNLVEKGVLKRDFRGRLEVMTPESRPHPSPTIGFLMPAPVSMWSTEWAWQRDLSTLVEQRHGKIRPIIYVGATDPVIFDALDGDFDGLFLILPPQISPLLADRLARKREKLVVLWQDTSHLEIPSIETGPSRFVSKIFDHLIELGHRRIDCLTTRGRGWTAQQRIACWKSELEKRGLEGRLHDAREVSIVPTAIAARNHMNLLYDRGEVDTTALFCIDTSHAWGAVRACQDRGVRVGDEISICGFGESEIAEMLTPSLTIVKPADRSRFLAMGLEWIESSGKNWSRPLRLEPDDVSLFIGESTGPAPSLAHSLVK